MLWCMRTTLTIDDDVAAAFNRLRRADDKSLKELVNEALRRGIKDGAGSRISMGQQRFASRFGRNRFR
jgi:Arc/MetJ family transcription regulator